MSFVFADTFYYFALLNSADKAHAAAHAFTQSFTGRIVTTEWILVEVADGLSAPTHRNAFVSLYRFLSSDPGVRIIGSDPFLFAKGLGLYEARPDKDWSLTDCISFAVMEREGIQAALTGDRHFEQAGYQILLDRG